MKKLILLIILFTVGYLSHGQTLEYGIKGFPSYDSVLNNFYTHYLTIESSSESYYSLWFARTPAGWSVCLKDYYKSDTIYFEFWTPKKGYLVLRKFDKNTSDSLLFRAKRSFNENNTSRKKREFRLHTYFGYTGWQEDVVLTLEQQLGLLNDNDLYSLARAFSSKYLEKTWYGSSSISEQELQEMLQSNAKAISYFELLKQRNPKFPVIVGKISTKTANEYVTGYYLNFLYKNQNEAKALLKSNIYSTEIITNAKNYLDQCPKDAILISNGDNDTYPLWYIQETMDYRKDVSVLNSALLNLPIYLKALRRNTNQVALTMSLTSQFYDSTKILTFYHNKGETILPLREFLDSVVLMNRQSRNGQVQIERYKYKLPGQKNIDSAVYPAKSYLYTMQTVLLDLLISSNRSLCFVHTEEAEVALGKHFVDLGLIYFYDVNSNNRISLDSLIDNFRNLDQTGYLDSLNYPKNIKNEKYLDDVFIRTIYNRLLSGMQYAKAENKIVEFEELKELWKNFSKNWALKPSSTQFKIYKLLK